jgi:hypothetical protein
MIGYAALAARERKMENTTLTHEFKGTPTEIGSQIWERICLPIVGKVSRDFSPQQLGQIYGGFVVSALGAMTADFGHEQALSFAREMFGAFESIAPSLADGTSVQ